VAWIELGRIRRPHGVKGWLHVESFTEPREALLNYRNWTLCRAGQRVPHVPLEGRLNGQELLVRLEGVEDRRAAQGLVGMMIEVARSELPPAGEREYYRADLIGLAVSNREGAELGVLARFVESAAGTVMVIRDAADTELWVPASPEHLWSVDLAAGRIVVDWPLESA
jgi:16S rRNA processing protein RimM